METTTSNPNPAVVPMATMEDDQCVVLRGVGWSGDRTLLRIRGERSVPRIICLDGDLWPMSPSFPHERLAERLGYFVAEVVVGANIPCVFAGHTTLGRRKKRGGVKGDKTCYLANEARVRGKAKLDLRTDPPPDLAIEAIPTHDVTPALRVWRRLQVPEIWACDQDGLRILVRQVNGRYLESAASASFPSLLASEIVEWVGRSQTVSETGWLMSLRHWVRETLVPRVQEPPHI